MVVLSKSARTPSGGEERIVIILGIVLIIIGWLANIGILTTIGIILVVVGVILSLLGAAGRSIGGRRTYF